MSFTSSPVVYPTSSAPDDGTPRKKRKISTADRAPLQPVHANARHVGIEGFILQDSDGDDDDAEDIASFNSRGATRGQLNGSSPRVQKSAALCDGENDVGHRFHGSLNNLDKVGICLTESNKGILRSGASIRCVSGRTIHVRRKSKDPVFPNKQTIAGQSNSAAGRSQNSYYGIDIHQLMEEVSRNNDNSNPVPNKLGTLTVKESKPLAHTTSASRNAPTSLMWTEKYRARKFTDLVGDERTHRSVLKWLKAWDSVVFPSTSRAIVKQRAFPESNGSEVAHKKILLLTGPPGLGKTTLAHVCARQAGYEVQEINASDERSRDVVKGRIRDMVGTENVKQVATTLNGKDRRVARPVCIVVDEVDGVVSGSGGGGEGGFIKALADLVALDQRNGNDVRPRNDASATQKKKNRDLFRLLRPLILICNDVYHPSLKLLRQGSMAEIIFVRKPPLNLVVPRVQQIFEQEGLHSDSDGIRQLCEATWGVSNRREEKTGGGVCEGDMRGILVMGEWVASKLRAESSPDSEVVRLTKTWVEQNIVGDVSHGGGSARSLGRGGVKELVDRIFAHNAGLTNVTAMSRANEGQSTTHVADKAKRVSMDRLRELITSNGEDDRAMTDCFSIYPSLPYQDDNFLTKPSHAYDWLYFHDLVSALVHQSQQWELAPYLPTSLLAFHDLFASNSRHSYSHAAPSATSLEDAKPDSESNVFTGLRASYVASETLKANRATLQYLQSQLSLPVHRAFRSLEDISSELVPFILRMLSPDVKPALVGGSENGVASVRRANERDMIRRGVDAMIACGVKFEKGRVDYGDRGSTRGTTGWVYRMEPGVDALGVYETAGKGSEVTKTRFAVRQVLEQEWKREVARREQEARVRRMQDVLDVEENLEVLRGQERENEPAEKEKMALNGSKVRMRTDFFGRPIAVAETAHRKDGMFERNGADNPQSSVRGPSEENKVWVTYHEGFSNAVRKGITLRELLSGFPVSS